MPWKDTENDFKQQLTELSRLELPNMDSVVLYRNQTTGGLRGCVFLYGFDVPQGTMDAVQRYAVKAAIEKLDATATELRKLVEVAE